MPGDFSRRPFQRFIDRIREAQSGKIGGALTTITFGRWGICLWNSEIQRTRKRLVIENSAV
jgi:hypothetical protein